MAKTIVALDYGAQRIGVAVGSTRFGVAFPRGFLLNESPEKTVFAIKNLVAQEQADMILLGIPRSMSGKGSLQQQVIMDFYQILQKELAVPVTLVDERLTTKIARAKMSGFGKSAKEQKEFKDELAAQVMLEEYLRSW